MLQIKLIFLSSDITKPIQFKSILLFVILSLPVSNLPKDKDDLVMLNESIFDFKDSVEIFSYIQKTNEEYLKCIILECNNSYENQDS